MTNTGEIAQQLDLLRQKAPLIHNITNYVAMNFTANVLLSAGASPVMAHALEEVEDMVGIADALVVNIGTLSRPWVESMLKAMRRAKSKGIPVVLDPVGVGATRFRSEVADLLLNEHPDIIRGNASEILALAKADIKTKGVDSKHASETAVDAARLISVQRGCIVCVSGATDYIIRQSETSSVDNGHPLMAHVTGMGCAATALIGAFAATSPSLEIATQAAMITIGVAGEISAEEAQGPGSFQSIFLDTLYNLTQSVLLNRSKIKAKEC